MNPENLRISRSILITGMSGTGKSTVCMELSKRGYPAVDIEDVPGLCEFINPKTGRKAEGWGYDDPKWFQENKWVCDKAKLEALMRQSGPGFYGGTFDNRADLLPLFDKVLVLTVSPETLVKRLRERTTNDFGRGPTIQKWLLEGKERWEEKLSWEGATFVNAELELGALVDEIIRLAEAR